MTATADTIIIRRAGAADAPVLSRLAALDSARIPSADSLIAEHGGAPVAALDLTDGRVVADPFARTAEVVELLTLRSTRVRHAHGRRRRGAWALTRRVHAGLTVRA